VLLESRSNNDGADDGTPTTALLALGLESGRIELFRVPLSTASSSTTTKPQLLLALPLHLCHIATVTKLAWRPRKVVHSIPRTAATAAADGGDNDSESLQLASSSLDGSVRICTVQVRL